MVLGLKPPFSQWSHTPPGGPPRRTVTAKHWECSSTEYSLDTTTSFVQKVKRIMTKAKPGNSKGRDVQLPTLVPPDGPIQTAILTPHSLWHPAGLWSRDRAASLQVTTLQVPG
jgi:hypothetical protein